jgi:succinyl-CoA synthetase beta subunit
MRLALVFRFQLVKEKRAQNRAFNHIADRLGQRSLRQIKGLQIKSNSSKTAGQQAAHGFPGGTAKGPSYRFGRGLCWFPQSRKHLDSALAAQTQVLPGTPVKLLQTHSRNNFRSFRKINKAHPDRDAFFVGHNFQVHHQQNRNLTGTVQLEKTDFVSKFQIFMKEKGCYGRLPAIKPSDTPKIVSFIPIMNIHEYQAKALFADFGIAVPAGEAVRSEEDINPALTRMPEGTVVVKAQIHAGGRGKGTFKDGFQGGVKIATDAEQAATYARRMLGNVLVTKQTGEAGRMVKTVYFAEPVDIEKEYYLAILLDRATSHAVIIASPEGGVDIEEVAEHNPDAITRVQVDPATGLQAYHKRAVAFALGFSSKELFPQISTLLEGLYRLFWEKDASMVEINPLITDKQGRILALDAKVGFDDNALFRQEEILALRDLAEEDPKEVEAGKYGLSYIALDGNIACLVNGAGLAMATMDIIKHFGGNPANFLDVGGGANVDQVTNAFRIILSDPNVEGILVNIFGGIMSCKTIADGIIAAAQNVDITVPLVVRLEGNQVAEGTKALADSGLALTPAESLSDAARKIVALVGASKQG